MPSQPPWFDIEPRGTRSLHGSLLRAAVGGGLPCALLALAFALALLELQPSRLLTLTLGSGLFAAACLIHADASRLRRPWPRVAGLLLFALLWTGLDIWFAGFDVGFRVHAFRYFELHQPPPQTLLLGLFLTGPAEARRWRLPVAEQMAVTACAYAGMCWFLAEELLFEHFRCFIGPDDAFVLGAMLPLMLLIGGRLQRRLFGSRGDQALDAAAERTAAGLPCEASSEPAAAVSRKTLVRVRLLLWAPVLLALAAGALNGVDAGLRTYCQPAFVVGVVFCLLPLE